MLPVTDNFGEERFCFICDNPMKNSTFEKNYPKNNKQQLSTLFCSIVSRYLDLKSFEDITGKTIASLQSNDDKILNKALEFCKSCSLTVKIVCELYNELKHLHLHLNWNLEKIGEVMKKSNQNRNNQLNFNQEQSRDFKQEFMKKVEIFKQSQFPQLKLDKITPSKEQLQNLKKQNMYIIKQEACDDDDDDVSWDSHNGGGGERDSQIFENHDDNNINCSVEVEETVKVKSGKSEGKIKRRGRGRPRKEIGGSQDIFGCAFCDKRFSRKDSVYKHEKFLHKGAKRFPCRICGERFLKFEERRAHHESHAENRMFRYKCKFCEKSFSKNKYRIQHVWTHTGLRPFHCSVCHRTFKDFSTANRHVKIRHKNGEVVKCFKSYNDFGDDGTLYKKQT